MSRLPWVVAQTLEDVLFAHWPVASAVLRSLVPAPLTLDVHGGTAWLGMVALRATGTRIRGTPALGPLSTYLQLNVRTYVKLGDEPGIFLLSSDTDAPLTALGGRALRLPLSRATMRLVRGPKEIAFSSRRIVRGGSAKPALAVRYHAAGHPTAARPGGLEHWLVERRLLHSIGWRGVPVTVEIGHEPWPLQAAVVRVEENSMAAFLGIALPDQAPLAHCVRRADCVLWPPRAMRQGSVVVPDPV